MRNILALTTLALLAAACSRPAVQSPPSPSPTSPATARAARPSGQFHTATATIRDGAGVRVGMVTFTDSYAGLIIAGNVEGLGLGAHGIHIHEVGKCEAPFTSAGGHFNPEKRHHGFRNPEGPHLGDLPNIDVPASGRLSFEMLLAGVTLKGDNALLDADGAAIVIHASRDDFATDPAGNAGGRLACGVITAS